ncbi:tRNA threonylcarbamoyladenosine biosynthesis protein TsaE [Okibacterium fritillariae]|uniref:tRNA threonylcarbamoyladenosine biosynthesis protein TsaE n=2 Tax=Okibacterium fritillariae TaxID=123320 RepID=A0A1T5K7W4_9MICO|nr:tRNA threonylcarbamoyladenosine biosynthesis protein TsaE [Okibacterium fritillariae]
MSGPQGTSGPGDGAGADSRAEAGAAVASEIFELPFDAEVPTAEDMHELGIRFAGLLRAGDLVVLDGPLGAGKTTLSRGIGEGLGIRGPVTSPTFVLARTHPSLVGGPPLVHVDAYRLGSALELDDLDIDFERSVVVVEWGNGMLDGVADAWYEVRLERPTDVRRVRIERRAAPAAPEA